jgi:hypothetical protein
LAEADNSPLDGWPYPFLITPSREEMGFKFSRYRQFWNVLKQENGQLFIIGFWWRVFGVFLNGIKFRSKQVGFYKKMRKCYRCVIFDPAMRKCRPNVGSNLGCGCYMPFKIRFGGGCWADDEGINQKHIGWQNSLLLLLKPKKILCEIVNLDDEPKVKERLLEKELKAKANLTPLKSGI